MTLLHSILPYEAFKIDKLDPASRDLEVSAYQLESKEVRVLTNSPSQPEIYFKSREEADVFLSDIKSSAAGQMVEISREDNRAFHGSVVSFEELKFEAVPSAQHRVEKEKAADTHIANDNNTEPDHIIQEDRAKANDSNNNLPDNLQNNIVDDSPNRNNSMRANEATAEVAAQGNSLQAAAEKAESEMAGSIDNGKRADLPSEGQFGKSILQGATAGVLEFLAESTDATPLMLMAANPITGLVISPIYSWAAERIHDLASEQLYNASQKNETAAQSASAVGYFGANMISAVVGPKGSSIQNVGAKKGAAAFAAVKNILRSGLKSPPRGYFTLGSKSSNNLTKLEAKLGTKAADLIYDAKRFFIASDKFLKNVKRGQGTGLDSNHLVLAEWLNKGPKRLQELVDFVPSYLLATGMEHQGTFHGAANQFLKSKGLFQQASYSQKQIERGMILLEKYYTNNPGGALGRAWSSAIRDFRTNIFAKAIK